MATPRRPPADPNADPDVDPERDEAEHPDHITQREGFEQELIEEGRSEDGEDVGQHVD
jgi:hypothetical protein